MKPRYTAMYHLEVLDSSANVIDQRPFIGTPQEALEELKEEYDTLCPVKFHMPPLVRDENHRGENFWEKRRAELGPCSMEKRTKVIGRAPDGTVRMIRMAQTSKLEEEKQVA